MSAAPDAIPGLYGKPLRASDYEKLAARWIDRPHAEMALLRRVDSETGRELVGRKTGNLEGVAIPYVWPGIEGVREYRLRRDHPDQEQTSAGIKEAAKYLSPPGRGNLLYLVPGTDCELLSDTSMQVVITEGEFKTIALCRLAWWSAGETAPRPNFLPMGLAGVSSWRSNSTKATSAEGARVNVNAPIADLSKIAWAGRGVTILFDADVEMNFAVVNERRKLTRELESRGAEVYWFQWPKGVPKEQKGIDDYLAANGPERTLGLLHKAKLKIRRKKSGDVVSMPPAGWQAGLLRNDAGVTKALLANAITALRDAPELDGVLAYDEFAMRTVMLKAPPWSERVGAWVDADDIRTAEWLQRNGIHVSSGIAAEAVQAVAIEHGFHPVKDYLNGLRWDGKKRLDTWLIDYLGARIDTNDHQRRRYLVAIGRRWKISAVARIMQPGCKADCVLTIKGGQGTLKSSAMRAIGAPWFTDEIADLGSKDSSMQTRGVWIIELAELDSMSRPEVGRVKAFMSRSVDRFRPACGRRVIEAPRECVFVGTVNHDTYLRDETGARRFWPVDAGVIDIKRLRADRDQLWAEAVSQYRDGATWWIDSKDLDAITREEQADRYDGDVWDAAIEEYVNGVSGPVSVQEILKDRIKYGCAEGTWTQSDMNRISRVLTALGWEKFRERVGTKLTWRYRRVEEKQP